MVNKNKPLVGGPMAGRRDGAVAAGTSLQPCMLAEPASFGPDAEQETFQPHSTDGGFSTLHTRKREWDGDPSPGGIDAIDATHEAGEYTKMTELKQDSRILARLGESETIADTDVLVSDGAGGVRSLDTTGGEVAPDSGYYRAREAITTAAGESALIICEVNL